MSGISPIAGRSIALDTETTGLKVSEGHRIVEVGAVEMEDGIRTGRSFHAYVNPQRDLDDDAVKVHGLTGEFLSDKPLFAEIGQSFADFLRDAPLVIHNAQFDMPFLQNEFRLSGLPLLENQALDTVILARQLYPGSPISLDALCRRFSIDTSARTLHGALLDADLLAEVYFHLTGGPQKALELGQIEKRDAPTPILNERQWPRRAAADITPDEIAVHQTFIEQRKISPF